MASLMPLIDTAFLAGVVAGGLVDGYEVGAHGGDVVEYHIDHDLILGSARANDINKRDAVERAKGVIAHRDERPLGQIVEQLLVVDAQLYVEVIQQTAAELRPGCIKIMVVNPVDLIDRKHLHEPLHKPGLALEERYHLHDVVIIEHGTLHRPWLHGCSIFFHNIYNFDTKVHKKENNRVQNGL